MPTYLLATLAAGYFALLLFVSRISKGKHDNDAFFRGSRQSPWWAVTFGMIGASISGVTFISVPGMVNKMGMTYLQTCMGFVLGYAFVAMVLLPIYYRLNLITIYTYLRERLGMKSYLTGAGYFFISKLTGASIRLYLVCMILQKMVFDSMGVGFYVVTALVLFLIWVYTRQSGIKTIVWSDCLQTFVLLAALVLIILQVCGRMELGLWNAICTVKDSDMSRIFLFDDANSKQYFWKQFLSGIFIVVVMTGLDQDMMQKNLTCKTLRESQLNMCINGVLYLPVNMLFLGLGVLLYTFCLKFSIAIPASGDELLPMLCGEGMLGQTAMLLFTIGIVAAAFSSADSAMTSLTTCLCVDLFRRPDDEKLRRWMHPVVVCAFFCFILLVDMLNETSVIDAVYTVCGYTYGPLLGLFGFGLLTKRQSREAYVPYICIAAPIICYLLDRLMLCAFGYKFGYELLMFNGFLTFSLLLLTSSKLCTDNAGGNGYV